ncbi:MAG: glycosyltransferase [Lentisphaerae bacterium]|nr:glycosyltransferase [Lentisphaerota bacterium]
MQEKLFTPGFVSVILPAYNTPEKFLRDAIESVLSQTYSEFELLIIDDSTTAPVENIVKSYTDERIKYFRNPENLGMAASRNCGLQLARGEFIALLDHDDLWLPEKLQSSLELFKKYQDAILVYSDTIPLGEYLNRLIEKQRAEGRIFSSMLAQNPILSMSCSVVKKSFLEKYNIKFNSDCVPCDDWDFHLQCALHGSIYCTAQPLVKYRYHENNLSSNAIKMYYAGINVIGKYQKLLDEVVQQTDCTRKDLQKSINYIAFKHYYGLAFEYLKLHEYKKAVKYLFRAFLYRPFKCINKILCYIGKMLKKKIYRCFFQVIFL